MRLSDLKNYKVVGSAQAQIATPKQPKSALETASDVGGFLFPGTKQIGESLGTIAAAGGRAIQGDTQGASDILKTQKTVPELIGAYTAAGASALGSAGVGTTGGVLMKALQSAGIGAAIGGGSSAAKGNDIGNVAKDTAIGGAIGGVSSLAFSGAEAALNSLKQLPQRLIRSATGQSKAEILAGKDISKYVLENKKIGTADQLIGQSQTAIDKADDFINQSLKSSSGDSSAVNTINRHLQEAQDVVAAKSPNFEALGGTKGLISKMRDDIVAGLEYEGKDAAASVVSKLNTTAFSSVDDFAKAASDAVGGGNLIPVKDIIADISSSINGAGGEIDDASVRSILEGLAPQVKKTIQKDALTLTEANLLRSQLDKTLGNRAFISAQLPYNKGILMDFTNALREQVKGRAPEGVRDAFNTLSNELNLRNLLLKKAAGASRNQIIGLGDLLSGGFGAAVGGPAGAIIGPTLKRTAESTFAKTATATIVKSLDTALSPVLAGLEPATQTAVMNAIIQAFQSLDQAKGKI